MTSDAPGRTGTRTTDDAAQGSAVTQIAIVLYEGLTALDAIGPYEVLRMLPGTEVRFVNRRPGPVTADSGVLVLGATHAYEETPSPNVVLVPGSEANTVTAMADGELVRWLRQVHKTSDWTVSVCSGALVLAAAGLLEGHPATTHWVAQKPLAAFGAIPQRDRRIVRSGKIVTAAGVSAGLDLAFWLAGELRGQERAEIVQLLLEYDPHPPFDSGHPSKASQHVRRTARREMLRRARSPRNAVSVSKVLWRRALQTVRRRLAKKRSS